MPLVAVRRWVREAGQEERLAAALTPQENSIYRSLVATSWVPVEAATRIYVVASPLLYPSDPAPLRRVGRELARDNFRGVFRYLAQLSSVEGLVNKTAFFWRAFHDQGDAVSERAGERHLRFSVSGYPNLPERMRETICGWLAQATELTGASHVSVTKSDEAEQRYFWAVTWR